MKARVFVFLKSTVLDPQGQTVRAALNGLGYPSISDVRQGKVFDIAIAGGVTREQARKTSKPSPTRFSPIPLLRSIGSRFSIERASIIELCAES